ncbi:MAG TPA: hypothetical protein VNP72_04645, partial [Longimicrobium sp.]|nr:hypothetical protein [Longimicrobium sp.]
MLDAWTALEVLAPTAFRRPHELPGVGPHDVVTLQGPRLPWAGAGEGSRPQKKLFYQVLLGTIDLQAAYDRLLSVYTDRRAERPPSRGKAILAAIVLDRDGCLVEGPTAVVVGSFGWGFPRALRGELSSLADWEEEEVKLARTIADRLRGPDPDHARPVDRRTLKGAYERLLEVLGLPADVVEAPEFAIRSYQYFRSPDPPEPILLNSFFLGDLARAKALFTSSSAPRALRLYMGREAPESR